LAFILLGISHKNAPLELREALALDEARAARAYAQLRADGLREAVLLSTCNRVEAYAVVDDVDAGEKVLRRALESLAPEKAAALRRSLSGLEDDEAVWHLLKVSSSLDSMVLGEAQILGQVKQAYQTSVDHGMAGPYLHGLFQRALAAAKEVRSKTELGRFPASVPSVAVHLAERVFGELSGRRGLIIGAGEMAELTAEHLKAGGISQLTFCNRSLSKAKEVAKRFGAQALPLDELESALGQADVAVFSTSASGLVLEADAAQRVSAARKGKPLLLLDIAVPRDVAPEARQAEGIYLYDVDSLSEIADEHRERRQKASHEAASILRGHFEGIRDWESSSQVAPAIAALTAKVEAMRRAELEKQSKHFSHLGAEDVKRIDYLTQAIIKKILNTPLSRLKEDQKQGQAATSLEALRRLFDLEEPD